MIHVLVRSSKSKVVVVEKGQIVPKRNTMNQLAMLKALQVDPQ